MIADYTDFTDGLFPGMGWIICCASYQPSTVNRQLLAVNCQLSTVNRQLLSNVQVKRYILTHN